MNKNNFRIELNEIYKQSFYKWFERNFSKKKLEEKIKSLAQQGYKNCSIDLTSRDPYEKERLNDPLFIDELRRMFPDLSVYYSEKKITNIIIKSYNLKPIIRKSIEIDWSDNND